MVKRLFCFLLMFLLTGVTTAQATGLLLVPEQLQQELGKPVQATLYAVDLPAKLVDVDLSPLQRHFGVETDYFVVQQPDKRWPGKKVQRMQIKLYPRQTGALTIPSISLADTHSTETLVNITSAKIHQIPFTLETRLTTTQPWQRQQLRVTLSIKTADKFPLLESQLQEVQPGVDVVVLPAERQRLHDSQYQSQIQLSWIITAYRSGQQHINLPPVKYLHSGVLQRVFYLPQITVNVRSLPPYIPPTMPVGKVDISSTVSTPSLLHLNTLYYWRITLESEQLASSAFPAVLRSVKSGATVQFFPFESQRDESFAADWRQTKIIHNIPFKALTSGYIDLPVIRFNYFEPESGKIISKTLVPPQPFALATIWKVSGLVIILILILRGLRTLQQTISRGLARFHNWRTTRQHLLAAGDVGEIKRVLCHWSVQAGQTKNGALLQLGQKIPPLAGPVTELYAACYGKSITADPVAIKHKLHSLFKWYLIKYS